MALDLGYRHIDTADVYGNHKEIAGAVSDWISTKNGTRSDIFITSKIWRTDLEKDNLLHAFNRMTEELQVDYIDQLLLHWPNKSIPISSSFEGLEELMEKGLIRSIGVSNCTQNHIDEIYEFNHTIQVNQVELHPTFNQSEMRTYAQKQNFQLVSYSPLGRNADLENTTVAGLAEKYSTTPGQVILNWHFRNGLIAIPKASTKNHLEDNLQALDWELDANDVQLLNDIEQQERMLAPSFNEFGD